jgi:hypothetical protein
MTYTNNAEEVAQINYDRFIAQQINEHEIQEFFLSIMPTCGRWRTAALGTDLSTKRGHGSLSKAANIEWQSE